MQTRSGNPSPSFTLTYYLSHTSRFTHTPTVHPFILPTVQRLRVLSDWYTHKHSRSGCTHGFGHVHTQYTHMLSCTLMKRKGIKKMVHYKQLCNCFWEMALVGGCHRLVFAEDNSVCGRRQWSLLDWLWYHFINSTSFTLVRREVIILTVAGVLFQTQCSSCCDSFRSRTHKIKATEDRNFTMFCRE